MRAMYKHQLLLIKTQTVPFSINSIAHFGEQEGNLMVWYETSDTQGSCILHIVGTGAFEIEDNWWHIATVHMSYGCVWHIYGEYDID